MSANIILYNASAGSGKTYRLAIEYLKILKKLQGSSFKNILAITFTNKACYEMKERILSFLKSIVLQNEKGKKLTEEIDITSEEADTLLRDIFLDYDKFQIKTIDSFLLNLYKALAYEMDLFSDFKIKTYLDEKTIEKALNILLEEAFQKHDLLNYLEKFLEYVFKVEEGIKINIKNQLISKIQELIRKTTSYRDFVIHIHKFKNKNILEFLKELEEQIKKVEKEEDYAKISAQYYIYLYYILKDKIEEVLKKEKAIYMGFWKEKLFEYLTEDFLPWVYVKLGILEAIIIDEFQDTDRLQWEAIKPLIENLIAENKYLICAGDPKQSIFKWRGADPNILNEIKEKFEKYRIKEEILNINYRSSPQIIDFNNKFFTFLKKNKEIKEKIIEALVFGKSSKEDATIKENIKSSITQKFEQTFSHIIQEKAKNLNGRCQIIKVYVEDNLNIFKKSYKNEIERIIKEKIYEEIIKILYFLEKEKKLEDTTILLRRNQDVAELSSYLISKGFRVLGTSFLKLKESPLINSLICALKFFNYPEDEIALFGILNSGFIEKGEKILNDFLNFKLRKGEFNLVKFVKEYYPEIWQKNFEEPLQIFRFCALYDFCRYIINLWQIEEKRPQELVYLYKFLSFILQFSKETDDLEEFLEYWDKYFDEEIELPQDEKAIKVFTIHSAKGLEFKNVILPLDWSEKDYKSELGFVFYNGEIYKARKDRLPPEVKEQWYLNKFEIKLELLNLLYVAFTRAIENLYILIPEISENIKKDLNKYHKYQVIDIFNEIYSNLEVF
ncbi:hypothetical protein DRN73_01220 [Candidatus Pacearchaeota archaeon]|nr:MAG: hypothetical protein DRN73_01220 [Candidatus Pacearchaeota archaeon]